ncbi:tRNA methyltransferase complex GCD14 subunit [Aureobasidium pullulans EXF-150]|uniref:tRNA (adenine(58)-N(1))-methyltransferase catalytic subunit TRM61 n=1 Tax=Aureobasidium pullulans EXF-150 TaxID=1043002 RepID=A0A074XXJ5_AURPU|nr:tRNA methyltransferase complex GCD14 subunit [Aureobasidium pullulans EXF-150]KEQ86627.1 tRNA methyltransferase complex GCD14 subunit [Aureobasidium pullulans EXF-150]
MATSDFKTSPFLDAGAAASIGSLAILHLKRDQLIPLILKSNADDGYAEGAVTNTRFGSFPHSTLKDIPWGTQVRASKVDTGSRGRGGAKRKIDDTEPPKEAIQAGTGFVHLLPPTPESWTISLPHRTQVVYTPDASYILQRLQVRPGQTIIEAGAGSGSFTHASARAVFNGYPSQASSEPSLKKRRYGRVCSFEYHEPRAIGLQDEVRAHGLDDLVRVTHRDVYGDGFLLNEEDPKNKSPKADAIFLDLPAPWMALKNLTRQRLPARTARIVANSASSDSADISAPSESETPTEESTEPFISPLNPNVPIHLCTFSPCIEQVTATIAALRRLGWTEIQMVEVMQKRIDVRRERVGLHEEGLRGVNASAATVDEAVNRLREVEGRFKEWHDAVKEADEVAEANGQPKPKPSNTQYPASHFESKQARLERIKKEAEERKTYKEGRLVHRTEPEIKTHTSYLVFAVLPREWSEEQEEKLRKKWGTEGKVSTEDVPKKGGKKAKKN